MIEELLSWQKKINYGIEKANEFKLNNGLFFDQNIKRVAFFGMGGSSIVGKILKTFLDKQTETECIVVDSDFVPKYLDDQTLAIVITYSGNTWETLECLNKIINQNIPTLVISHGGAAKQIAFDNKFFFIEAPISQTPRSALGSFLGIVLTLFDDLGLISGKKILEKISKHIEHILPMFTKSYFHDFINLVKNENSFFVWGVSNDCDSAAYRAQTQFNENSKVPAVYSAFSELCHNLLVGFTNAEKSPLIIFFHTEFLTKSMKNMVLATSSILSEVGARLYKPPVLGDTWEVQLFHIILWADFASFYLAEEKGVDATPVKIIEALKEKQKLLNLGGS